MLGVSKCSNKWLTWFDVCVCVFSLQVTMIIEHVMCLVVSIPNARPHVTVNELRLIVRHEVLKKSHEIYHFTPPNCKCKTFYTPFNTRKLENQLFWNYVTNHKFISISNNLSFSFRLLNDNELGRIKSDGLFGRLPNLVKLDLRRNQITGIEPNAFEGASKIQDMLISENKITEIHNKMFLGLHNLKSL